MITIVVADDEALVRSGLRMILEAEPDLTVVAEAADGVDAVRLTREHRPDVLLADVRMPVVDGIEAARQLTSRPDVGTAVVLLTTFDTDDSLVRALRAGAAGFLLKSMPREQLVGAVRSAVHQDALLAPTIVRRLLDDFVRRRGTPRPEDGARIAGLSSREREVLVLMARGLSNAELAGELGVGIGTVKTHVAAVLSKLGVRDRVQAVIAAFRSGLATTD